MDAEKVINKAKSQREAVQNLLRPTAEFFHEHEGEMFERYEAVDKLQKHLQEQGDLPLKEFDGDTERLLHKVISNLATDRVDPVQNVVKEGKKWIGVIEYHEHDYWYEYVEHDDVHGRVNVGICAQCVQNADNDAQVAKGSGTTEELAERIRDHYDAEHSEDPESVETGATLVSGTTIAGNAAIHTANDGTGSGLDADLFRGTQGSSLIQENTGYAETVLNSGSVFSKFTSPSSNPRGLGVDSNDSIWSADNTFDNASIYKLDRNGNEITRIDTPEAGGTEPSGVDIDSSDSIWNTDSGTDSVYKVDSSGNILTQFSAASSSPGGLGVDSNDSIFHVAQGSIWELDTNGTVISNIATPSATPTGLGIDSDDSIWNSDAQEDKYYKLTNSGSIISSFNSPCSFPWGIGFDSSSRMWTPDGDSSEIYEILKDDLVKYE